MRIVISKVSDTVFRKSFYLAFVFRSFSLVKRTVADWLIEVALNKMTYEKRCQILHSLYFLGFHTLHT